MRHRLDHVQRSLDLDVLRAPPPDRAPGGRSFAVRVLVLRDLDDDIRVMPLPVDRAALGREVLRGRQSQPRPVRERNDRLDRALCRRSGCRRRSRAPILKRACPHDLRRRRLPWLTSHDHRQVGYDFLAWAEKRMFCSARGPLGVDHELSVVDELFRDLDRRGQEAAGVVAQVKDQGPSCRPSRLLERRGHVTKATAPETAAA